MTTVTAPVQWPRRVHVPMPTWKRPYHAVKARRLIAGAGANIAMFDSTVKGNLPPNAQAYLYYVDGAFAYTPPPAQYLLPTTVIPGSPEAPQAACIDVEQYCYSNAQVYGIFTQLAALRVVYTSVSNVDAMVATMTANGFARASYRLLSAHYAGYQHICGPSTCQGCANACDGTQWASNNYYDTSILSPAFFGDAPASSEDDNMTATLFFGGHWYFYAIGPDGRVNVYVDNAYVGQIADAVNGKYAEAKGSLSGAVDTSGNVLLLCKGLDNAIWKLWQTAGKGTWSVSSFGGVLG